MEILRWNLLHCVHPYSVYWGIKLLRNRRVKIWFFFLFCANKGGQMLQHTAILAFRPNCIAGASKIPENMKLSFFCVLHVLWTHFWHFDNFRTSEKKFFFDIKNFFTWNFMIFQPFLQCVKTSLLPPQLRECAAHAVIHWHSLSHM